MDNKRDGLSIENAIIIDETEDYIAKEYMIVDNIMVICQEENPNIEYKFISQALHIGEGGRYIDELIYELDNGNVHTNLSFYFDITAGFNNMCNMLNNN